MIWKMCSFFFPKSTCKVGAKENTLGKMINNKRKLSALYRDKRKIHREHHRHRVQSNKYFIWEERLWHVCTFRATKRIISHSPAIGVLRSHWNREPRWYSYWLNWCPNLVSSTCCWFSRYAVWQGYGIMEAPIQISEGLWRQTHMCNTCIVLDRSPWKGSAQICESEAESVVEITGSWDAQNIECRGKL